MQVAIIGGGAAGFFAAIHVKENFPNAEVVIFEKSQKVLSKVRISGGGRCNVTNAETSIALLSKAYPRGGKLLKSLFPIFSTKETVQWFEKRNVPLVVQEDNCIFPKSQSSQSVIDCFMKEVYRLGVEIKIGLGITKLEKHQNVFHLTTNKEVFTADKVIVAIGGSPKLSGLKWLEELGHEIAPPVPSLFSFNMPNENIKSLMGVVVENASARIIGHNFKSSGPLLITHWGMSGPCILVLSSHAARVLANTNYQFSISVNWIGQSNQELIYAELKNIIDTFESKQLSSIRPFFIPTRLWHFILEKGNFNPKKRWKDVSKKELNSMVEFLSNDNYAVHGKTTFKEEFVTCGGVSLNSINKKTLESKTISGLYFAGEVMDIDAVTGGYNFQAAWTTAFVAAKLKSSL